MTRESALHDALLELLAALDSAQGAEFPHEQQFSEERYSRALDSARAVLAAPNPQHEPEPK